MAYDFHQTIPDAAATKFYANKHDKYIKRFNNESVKRSISDKPLPKVFPQGGEEKDLKYQRGGSRRQVYTGSEAAEVEETEARRCRRRALIETLETG